MELGHGDLQTVKRTLSTIAKWRKNRKMNTCPTSDECALADNPNQLTGISELAFGGTDTESDGRGTSAHEADAVATVGVRTAPVGADVEVEAEAEATKFEAGIEAGIEARETSDGEREGFSSRGLGAGEALASSGTPCN